VTTYYEERHPVRKIPTAEQLAEARKQARQQAMQEASHHRVGHSSGLHPEDETYELIEDDEYYQTRMPTSAIRYQNYQVSPEEVYQSGNTRYHVRYIDVPKRSSRHAQTQLPPPYQRERYAEEVEALPQAKRHIHPVAWFGLFLTLLILGWIGLNFATSWYQGIQNDWTYGQQRHFEINAIVGHNNDSSARPSHFIAENTNGQIIVIELPAGDVNHAKIYQIETVPGNAGNPPVKLSFQDMNGDGKVDMIVMIGDGNAMIYLTLLNNGTQFVSKLS
jgi:hypothetical protein